MPDAPLSRRARRAQEAQAAERAAAQNDPTAPLPESGFTGEVPEYGPDGKPLSRRDRRRLERLSRPMEAWTAEEEMIATGQIPAMTPERIAEQERLAREAAERAAADAQTASQELRVLAEHDLKRPGTGDTPQPPTRVSSADVPLVQPAPRAEADAPLEERRIVEPYSPRFELDEDDATAAGGESPSVEIPTGYDPEAKIERTPAPTGQDEPGFSGEPTAWPADVDGALAPPSPEVRPATVNEPAVSSEATPDAQEPHAQEPSMPEPAAGEDTAAAQTLAAERAQAAASLEAAAAREAEAAAARAKVFEELFPPGSSQAALLEHSRDEPAASEQAAPSQTAEQDDEEAERLRGIEEIRRLTEAAISGLGPTTPHHDEEPTSAAADAPAESANRFEMPPDPEGHDTFQGFRTVGQEQPPEPPLPTPGALAPPSGQLPLAGSGHPFSASPQPEAEAAPAPHQAAFDETARAASTEIPVRSFDQPGPAQNDAASGWGSHPLDSAAPSGVPDVNDYKPVTNVPRPDLSQVNAPRPGGPFAPVSGQNPTTGGEAPTASGQFPGVNGEFQPNPSAFGSDPSATGQIAPIRRVPDLPPVGGAGHFRWHHLAVIGALVFVLGVIIYNVWLGK